MTKKILLPVVLLIMLIGGASCVMRGVRPMPHIWHHTGGFHRSWGRERHMNTRHAYWGRHRYGMRPHNYRGHFH